MKKKPLKQLLNASVLIKGTYDVGFWYNPSSASLWNSAAQVQHHKFRYTPVHKEAALVYQKCGSSFNPMFVVFFL